MGAGGDARRRNERHQALVVTAPLTDVGVQVDLHMGLRPNPGSVTRGDPYTPLRSSAPRSRASCGHHASCEQSYKQMWPYKQKGIVDSMPFCPRQPGSPSIHGALP